MPTYRVRYEEHMVDVRWQVRRPVTLFLCGDVMTGRGVDQILPHPGDPTLHEPFVTDAREYVALAERRSGLIRRAVDFDYVWGDAIEDLRRVSPHVRIINLETAVTSSDDRWRGKQVHYRMNPPNIPCLTAANVDCAVLANNHVLDWGYAGLEETLQTLETAGIAVAGAGRNQDDAQRPAVFRFSDSHRLLVFGVGSTSSGVPGLWEATNSRSGIHLTDESSNESVHALRDLIDRFRQPGDVVVVSIHWGSNWGYEIPAAQRSFAHTLIDHAGVDIVHGHSSHHVRGMEVYHNRLILYGCGDLLTDYEGIRGHERYRGDLGLLYFAHVDAATGQLLGLTMRPTRVRRMQLRHPSPQEVAWLINVLNREEAQFGGSVVSVADGFIELRWPQ